MSEYDRGYWTGWVSGTIGAMIGIGLWSWLR